MNVRTQALTLFFALALLFCSRLALAEEQRPRIQKWPPTLEELVRDAKAATVPSLCDLSIVEKHEIPAVVAKYDQKATDKYDKDYRWAPGDEYFEMCYYYLLRAYCFSADGDFLGLQQRFAESDTDLDGTVEMTFSLEPCPVGTRVMFVELEDWLVRGMPKKKWYTRTWHHFTTMYPNKRGLSYAFTLAPVDRDFGAWVKAGGLKHEFISKATLVYSVGERAGKPKNADESAKQ